MCANVCGEVVGAGEATQADVTLKRFLACVYSQMASEFVRTRKPFSTTVHRTRVRLFRVGLRLGFGLPGQAVALGRGRRAPPASAAGLLRRCGRDAWSASEGGVVWSVVHGQGLRGGGHGVDVQRQAQLGEGQLSEVTQRAAVGHDWSTSFRLDGQA